MVINRRSDHSSNWTVSIQEPAAGKISPPAATTKPNPSQFRPASFPVSLLPRHLTCRLQPAVLRLAAVPTTTSDAHESTSGTATPDLTHPKSQHLGSPPPPASRSRPPSAGLGLACAFVARLLGSASSTSPPPRGGSRECALAPPLLQISPAACSVGPGRRARAKLGCCVPGGRRCGGALRFSWWPSSPWSP